MNQARANQLLSSLTSIAQRVYEVVPIQEPWNAQQIITELVRQGKVARVDQHVLDGCLGALVRSTLVKELPKKLYIRRPIRSSVSASKEPEMASTSSAPSPKPTAGTLAHFSEIAGQLRDIAAQAEALADDLEAAALAVEERVEHAKAGSEKLRQLKTLLAELQ